MLRAAAFSVFIATQAAACDLALVLAVDVSGSVDPEEYRIQMDGLAAALRNGIVAEALVDQKAMLTLLQWTGASRQRQTIPWTQMTTFAHVDAYAERVATDPRIWRNFSTAIGEALVMSRDLLSKVPNCTRHVVDVSGDGRSNEGVPPLDVQAQMKSANVTINALAIETDEDDLTAYFFENLIRGERAFVETANGFEDYPAAILRKLQRETTRIAADAREIDEYRQFISLNFP